MQTFYGTKRVVAERQSKGAEDGYTVRYDTGCIAWRQKDNFETIYRYSGQMDFGHALYAMREGKKIKRIVMPKGTYLSFAGDNIFKTFPDGVTAIWSASQFDILATDWGVVE